MSNISCCSNPKSMEVERDVGKKILLMGNPNVGKSVVFSKLTGLDVMTANYPGTTVDYSKGKVNYRGETATIIDVPGVYSLEATSEAEKVAVDFLERENPDGIICVLDATNLQRNIDFAYQIREYDIPVVFALNLLDVAQSKSIHIDIKKLEQAIGAPVISTIAVRNIGLKEIMNKCFDLAKGKDKGTSGIEKLEFSSPEDRWQESIKVAEAVQTMDTKARVSKLDRFSDLSLTFFPGIFIAIAVLLLTLGVVVGGGKALRVLIFLPLLDRVYVPIVSGIVNSFISEGMIYNILIGEYGMLIKGVEWPFTLVLPYVILFYGMLSLLEDTGYLPHLGVVADGALRKVGIQGNNIVPFIMGYGCAVPAIIGSRAANTRKERLIISTVVTLSVPCIAQTGAFIALLGSKSVTALLLVYAISFVTVVIAGMIMTKLLKGKISPMLIEVPNILIPNEKALFKKIWIRVKSFMIEAELPMIMAVGIAAIVAETGVLNYFGIIIEPLVVNWLGLPPEAGVALLLGVIRRELAVLPLLELDLTLIQLTTGALIALFYLPCLSVFGVLVKEFRVKAAVMISILTIVVAFTIGGLINKLGILLEAII